VQGGSMFGGHALFVGRFFGDHIQVPRFIAAQLLGGQVPVGIASLYG